MLFFAVFCGFLAEYQLEHKIEKDRAKELARTFYEEIKQDSVNMSVKVQSRLRQEASIKWLIAYYKDSSLTRLSKAFSIHFLYGVYFRTPSLFEARTVVLDQLKNSGASRPEQAGRIYILNFRRAEFQKQRATDDRDST